MSWGYELHHRRTVEGDLPKREGAVAIGVRKNAVALGVGVRTTRVSTVVVRKRSPDAVFNVDAADLIPVSATP